MRVFLLQITLRAAWVHSLKEKRMVVKSLVAKLKNKFNISVSEISEQDIHQTIVIGIAGVCDTTSQADSYIDTIIEYVEESTDAEIIDIKQEVEVYQL